MTRSVALLPELNSNWKLFSSEADQGLLDCLAHMVQAGQVEDARKLCEDLSQTRGSGRDALLSRILAARAWVDIADHKSALAHCDAIVELEPAYTQQLGKELNSVAWGLATTADLKLRDGAQAVQLAERAVKLYPENG